MSSDVQPDAALRGETEREVAQIDSSHGEKPEIAVLAHTTKPGDGYFMLMVQPKLLRSFKMISSLILTTSNLEEWATQISSTKMITLSLGPFTS